MKTAAMNRKLKNMKQEKDKNNAVKQAREICRSIEADEVRRIDH